MVPAVRRHASAAASASNVSVSDPVFDNKVQIADIS
jgi:hypothetical protein